MKKRQITFFLSIFLNIWLFLAPFGVSYAQTPQLPGSADPSRLQERLLIPQINKKQNIIEPKEIIIADDIPQNSEGFILKGITLEGVTAFEENHFDSLIAEYIGLTIDIDGLEHLSSRITQIYRSAGYFLCKAIIPQQEVVNGIVIIKVIEGQVGKVILEDNNELLQKDHLNIVHKTIHKIEKLTLLHGPTLERYVLLLNDHIGVTIQNILQAPQTTSQVGNVDIILRVLPNPKQNFFLAYNNHGSRFIGPHQITTTYQNTRLLNSFDRLIAQATTTIPMNELQFASLSYALPLNEEGLTATLTSSYSNSEPGLSLRNLNVEGDSTAFNASLTYPLMRSRKASLTVGSSFEILNSATEFLDEELIDDKVRELSLFASYNTKDKWGGVTDASISLSKGLNIFGATETGYNKTSRSEGRSDFVKSEFNALRQQNLGKGLQIINSVSAQYAPHPLLSSKEFGYGGTSYGRAYDPSEITGDQGISAAVEILYKDIETISDLTLNFIPFVYYDIGKIWNEDSGSKPISAASAGLGTYYNFNSLINGRLQFAYPLTKPASNPIMNGDNSPRILFSLNTSF
ncbi:MAG: ShlB/FhaC/HecB family hemolysin secretion/activation protein [Alphaproteobacteria bacterium]|nr:ShlB/FhaC/HecB family hemolysin secretion/activation protein [Alphaproteobacteria bacterium]